MEKTVTKPSLAEKLNKKINDYYAYSSDEYSFRQMFTKGKVKSIIACIIVGLFIYLIAQQASFTAPQYEDYLPFHNQLEAASNNPEFLFQEGATFTVKDGLIEYTVGNKKCQVTGYYDQNFSLVKTVERSLEVSLPVFIIAMIITSVLVFMFLKVILELCSLLIIILISTIVDKYLRKKELISEFE